MGGRRARERARRPRETGRAAGGRESTSCVRMRPSRRETGAAVEAASPWLTVDRRGAARHGAEPYFDSVAVFLRGAFDRVAAGFHVLAEAFRGIAADGGRGECREEEDRLDRTHGSFSGS